MSKPSRPAPTAPAPAAPTGSTVPDDRPTSALRQAALRLATSAVTTAFRVYRIHPAIWRFTARNYHPAMERFARLNAWMICQHAYLDVPAYTRYVEEGGFRFRWWDLTSYRPTSKHDYVDRYPEDERCWHGVIETVGTVVDESSGSSGTPYNWMRSKRELNTVHKNVAGYITQLFGTQRLFAINAFSMGAWATGTNTGIAMSKIAMVKNTGPEIDKIVDTLRHFGPRYTYLSAPTRRSSSTCATASTPRASTGTATTSTDLSAARRSPKGCATISKSASGACTPDTVPRT